MVQMNPVIARGEKEKSSLIFNRYGNQHFFAQAWMPGNDGLVASKSSSERGVQREMAGDQAAKSESVALRTR